jgi:large subunit ribosomal protein L30
MPDYLRIRYIRSAIDKPALQQRTIKALGLRRLHGQRVFEDNASLRGMIDRVRHLVELTPATSDDFKATSRRLKRENSVNA